MRSDDFEYKYSFISLDWVILDINIVYWLYFIISVSRAVMLVVGGVFGVSRRFWCLE